ncbi:MAG: multidrug transporter permease, partial [Bacilli bacterium]|nr:multidrug transporter permease [Bacilli bacterium]
VALLGTVLVIVGGPGIALGAKSITGDLMMLSRSIMGAIYLLMVAKLMVKYPVRQMLALEYTFGALFLCPFLFVQPAAWVTAVILSWSSLRILLFSSICALGISFLIHNGSVGKIGGFRVAAYGYLQPLTALLFGWWLLGESITGLQVLGGIAILGAMYVVQRQKWENADQ